LGVPPNSIIIIADDLTGANDTGVQFARYGLQTEVLLEGASLSSLRDASVVVIDTNSRAIPSEEAYRKVREVAEQAHRAGFHHYYKKLDSTLRGNIGQELRAILDIGIHDFAFVMPAFPKNGRTTVGGQHLLQGIPLSATEIAKDPKCPVRQTCLPELLQQQAQLPVGHIGINELSQGEAAVSKAIKAHIANGCKIISCDAWLDEHFLIAANAVKRISDSVVWAGSAGLAEYLPQLLGWEEMSDVQLPTLVIAGSVSSVTRGQIDRLLADGYELLELEVADYLPWEGTKALPLVQKALEKLNQGKRVILASGYQPSAVERAKEVGATLGLTPVQVSEVIATILGWIGEKILREKEVAGVILTGGDTAVSVCRALGVTGIRILEEVAPAIPLGEMKTADGKLLRVVTKAGAFGSSDALVIATRRLQKRK
jgi:D-threonate/D-erythronate kinase